MKIYDTHPNQKKKERKEERKEERKAFEWTRHVEIREEEIPGRGLSMQ